MTPSLNPDWITGFADGEGCFAIVIYSRESKKTPAVQFSFSIGLAERDIDIIKKIKEFFGGGFYSIRKNKGDKIQLRFINYFSKALGLAIAKNPQINSIVRFGKIYPRKNVDIFFHVVNNYKDGEDLSGFVMRSVDKKNLREISSDFYYASKEIKAGKSKNDQEVKSLFKHIPGFISRWVLDSISFLLFTLNLWSPLMRCPRDFFGGIMLTYIGSLGADNAFAPIAPYTRIPMVVSLGAIKKRPWVIGNRVVARNTVKVGIVFDHRICDGVQMQKLISDLVEFMESAKYEDRSICDAQEGMSDPTSNTSPRAPLSPQPPSDTRAASRS